MKLVDLSLEPYDGFQSRGAHARTTVMDFVTRACSVPWYSPPCRGFAMKLLIASDHARTHVDVPYHFIEDGPTIERVQPETLLGPAVVLDVTPCPRAGEPATAAATRARVCAEGKLSVKRAVAVLD
jgi:arylformamidase